MSGPPDYFKTTFSRNLVEKTRTVIIEYGQDSYNSVHEGIEILVMDGIRSSCSGKPPIEFLERLCDCTKILNVKYERPRKTPERVIVILLSNLTLAECYPEDNHGVLKARFNEIRLTRLD